MLSVLLIAPMEDFQVALAELSRRIPETAAWSLCLLVDQGLDAQATSARFACLETRSLRPSCQDQGLS